MNKLLKFTHFCCVNSPPHTTYFSDQVNAVRDEIICCVKNSILNTVKIEGGRGFGQMGIFNIAEFQVPASMEKLQLKVEGGVLEPILDN